MATENLARSRSLRLAAAGTWLACACGSATQTVWQSNVTSPDGRWIASAMMKDTSGPGNNYLATIVVLKRPGSNGRGIEVLSYPQNNLTKAKADRDHPGLSWLTPSHLQVSFNQIPEFDFQAIKCADVEISVAEAAKTSQ
jgi:hypothetical protein